MPLTIGDRVIERVQIVDDDPGARDAYGLDVEDLNLIPVQADKPVYTDLPSLIQVTRADTQAAICDYHLSARNYATFNGGQMVAKLYTEKFPAILCTKYYQAEVDGIRAYRHRIPVLLTPDSLEPETIIEGFRRCIAEFEGNVPPSRKAWRSLVRVEDIDEDKGCFYVIVPGWNSQEAIRLQIGHVPHEVKSRILNGHVRFHAEVNIGAEKSEDLYFIKWEQE